MQYSPRFGAFRPIFCSRLHAMLSRGTLNLHGRRLRCLSLMFRLLRGQPSSHVRTFGKPSTCKSKRQSNSSGHRTNSCMVRTSESPTIVAFCSLRLQYRVSTRSVGVLPQGFDVPHSWSSPFRVKLFGGHLPLATSTRNQNHLS